MTPERFARISAMLANRQPDLTVCLEGVHKPHNLSAIVRTCDAVGVSDVHAVWLEPGSRKLAGSQASGSQNWVRLHHHDNVEAAVAALRGQKMQILVTHLSPQAVDFRDIDYTRPTAILLGQERDGVTEQALALADAHIIIPMVGMVQSLNVSVANALVLYEAMRQRQQAGMYGGPCRLPETEQQRILFEGGHPVLAKICRRKGLPYPPLDEQGQIAADDSWWQKMQMSREAWDHLDDDDND